MNTLVVLLLLFGTACFAQPELFVSTLISRAIPFILFNPGAPDIAAGYLTAGSAGTAVAVDFPEGDSQINQKWYIGNCDPALSGYSCGINDVVIFNLNGGSGVLDAAGANPVVTNNLALGATSQNWNFVATGSGDYYYITNLNSEYLCNYVNSGQTQVGVFASNAYACQWQLTSTTCQGEDTASLTDPTASTPFQIYTIFQGQVLYLTSASDSASIFLTPTNAPDDLNQKWFLGNGFNNLGYATVIQSVGQRSLALTVANGLVLYSLVNGYNPSYPNQWYSITAYAGVSGVNFGGGFYIQQNGGVSYIGVVEFPFPLGGYLYGAEFTSTPTVWYFKASTMQGANGIYYD